MNINNCIDIIISILMMDEYIDFSAETNDHELIEENASEINELNTIIDNTAGRYYLPLNKIIISTNTMKELDKILINNVFWHEILKNGGSDNKEQNNKFLTLIDKLLFQFKIYVSNHNNIFNANKDNYEKSLKNNISLCDNLDSKCIFPNWLSNTTSRHFENEVIKNIFYELTKNIQTLFIKYISDRNVYMLFRLSLAQHITEKECFDIQITNGNDYINEALRCNINLPELDEYYKIKNRYEQYFKDQQWVIININMNKNIYEQQLKNNNVVLLHKSVLYYPNKNNEIINMINNDLVKITYAKYNEMNEWINMEHIFDFCSVEFEFSSQYNGIDGNNVYMNMRRSTNKKSIYNNSDITP